MPASKRSSPASTYSNNARIGELLFCFFAKQRAPGRLGGTLNPSEGWPLQRVLADLGVGSPTRTAPAHYKSTRLLWQHGSGFFRAEEERLLRRLIQRYPLLMFNLYPPLLGAGIRVTRIQPDWKEMDVEMRLRWWNANYVGTQYGGSLYSMADPFLMVMFLELLGKDYVVWDKAASIRFRRPGRGTAYTKFRIEDGQVAEIRAALEKEEKIEREFAVGVKDESGELIAEVKKLLHFRKKGKQL